MLRISQLFIYPIKSLGGIEINTSKLTDRGFEYDRRWMLVDSANRFFTQREHPQMALLQVTLSSTALTITHKISGAAFEAPLEPETNDFAEAVIWDDICRVQFVSPDADKWFSQMLNTTCRLVYMPDDAERKVEEAFAINQEITSLSDGYPLLIVGQSSLNDLNSRLEEPLPINRFRPNIVFTGGEPYQEDSMRHFTINGIDFFGVKPCARCPIPTINQETADRAKEPLKTLAAYRMQNNKVYFGQNLLYKGTGILNTGDEIIF